MANFLLSADILENPAGPRLPSLPKLNAFFGAAHGEAAAGLEQEDSGIQLKAGEEEKGKVQYMF